MGFEILLIERYKSMAVLLDKADKSIEPNQGSLMEAAVIGCSALKDLAAENISNEFRQAVRQLEGARRESRAEFVAITQTFGHFSTFLTVERRVLIAGGFPEYLANQIIQWCFDSYEELRKGEMDSDALFERVRLLRNQACELAEELKTGVKQEAENESSKRILKSILKAMAGAALIGLNAIAAFPTGAATASLTVAGAAISGVAGSLLLNSAWSPRAKGAGGAES